jgi:hypothetical protein
MFQHRLHLHRHRQYLKCLQLLLCFLELNQELHDLTLYLRLLYLQASMNLN